LKGHEGRLLGYWSCVILIVEYSEIFLSCTIMYMFQYMCFTSIKLIEKNPMKAEESTDKDWGHGSSGRVQVFLSSIPSTM
jgi:hypothetical protein